MSPDLQERLARVCMIAFAPVCWIALGIWALRAKRYFRKMR